MNKRISYRLLLSLVFMFALATAANAQSQTFVSAESGDDNNPCSLALPCRTFTQAINVVQPRGEVVALSSGEYAAFIANKSVSIYAAPGAHPAVVASTGIAVVVSPPANGDVVTLSGLTINGLGGGNFGINVSSGALNVEKCVVENFKGSGIFSAFDNVKLSITDTVVRNCGSGVRLEFTSSSSKATLERCRLEKSTTAGLSVGGNARVTARACVMSGNGTGAGVIVSNGSRAELSLEDCLITDNGVGLNADRDGSFIRVSNSAIVNNGSGVRPVAGASIISRRNNTVEGNVDDGAFTGGFFAK